MLQQVKTRREVELEGQVETFRLTIERQNNTIQFQKEQMDKLKWEIQRLIEMSTESMEVATLSAGLILPLFERIYNDICSKWTRSR